MTWHNEQPNLLRERLPFRPLGGERCVTSLELAREIGFADPRRLDHWIMVNRDQFVRFGPVPMSVDVHRPIGGGRVRKVRSYWLTGEQVIIFLMKCQTERTKWALMIVLDEISEMEKELGLNDVSIV